MISVSVSYRFTLNANLEKQTRNQMKDTNNKQKKDTKRRRTETVKTRNKERNEEQHKITDIQD